LAREVVEAALEGGCRVVDTSPMYEGAERALSGIVRDWRHGVAVATKIWAGSAKDEPSTSVSEPGSTVSRSSRSTTSFSGVSISLGWRRNALPAGSTVRDRDVAAGTPQMA